jgi:pimeloyl-ACP methyl ester carboxylesterase
MNSKMSNGVAPFELHIPQSVLDDLHDRLRRTRWPEAETVEGWRQGAPLAAVQDLCSYWLNRYDWRRCEAMLNGWGQFRTNIDGLGIHFLHIRSPEPDALPLIITHGWPGSILEFRRIFGPLADPAAHGGKRSDAFHVVAPCLPGYGFSDRPGKVGWSIERIARAWIELMQRLGYTRFVAQGGDWGSAVARALATSGAVEVAAIHLNLVAVRPEPEDLHDLTESERAYLADFERYAKDGSAYAQLQSTRPQTLGYGLTDSPAGQAAWILEKLAAWSDCNGRPTDVFTYDEIIDNIMMYWLPATAASSARLYWESFASLGAKTIGLPVACSIYPKEIIRSSRRWAERKFSNIIYWNELDRGGHFAAWEQPQLFVAELRNAFATLRQS